MQFFNSFLTISKIGFLLFLHQKEEQLMKDIIKEHYQKYPLVLRGLYDEVEEELNDIAPQYKSYCEIKRDYQLGKTTKEAVIKAMHGVCKEIEDFIQLLYSSTDMPEERDELKLLINKIYNKNV